MTDAARLYEKTLSLGSLETQVAADEGALGTLKALGLNPAKTRTVAAFKRGRSPEQPVELKELVGGNAVFDKQKYDKVCEGTVFIAGQERPVVAIRKKAD